MYGGDEMETTGEDLELERYGLTEGFDVGSGESDVEEALYSQVHYCVSNDDDIGNTSEQDGISRMEALPPLTTDPPTTIPERDDKDEIHYNTTDVIIDDDSNNDDRNWKRVESDSKYKVRLKTNSPKAKADVVKVDSKSNMAFIDAERNAKDRGHEEKIKTGDGDNPRKRSWRKTTDDHCRKITKIDRTSWSSGTKRPGTETSISDASKVVIVADDSSSSSVIVLDSERSEEEVPRPKQRPRDGGKFFLDNKGMALDNIQKEKHSAELEWKAEREKTKAMLKEGMEIIDLVSDEDDCMVIESCSEEEGMHVHFDEEGDPMPPEENDSGNSKGRRKDKGKVAPGRYFVQSHQKRIRCNNCFEMGHLKAECPQPPRIPACILCGTRGHTDRQCPDALCFNCSLPGHQSRSCPHKRNMRYSYCSRCQMPGHLRKMCPDIWRQYHLTTEHGPIIRPTNQHHRTKEKDVYCSNCSKKGHRFYDCHGERFDEFAAFTYDKVCSYDTKHIGKMVYPDENKNAEYLKLLKERKDEAPLSMTKGLPRMGKKRKFPVDEGSTKKLIGERIEKVIGEIETDSVTAEKEESGEVKKPNPVQMFVRTRLFGGKKGKNWAQGDETLIPSRREQQSQQQMEQQQLEPEQQHAETGVVSNVGNKKLKKAQKKAEKRQKKAERRARAAQQNQVAKEIRSLSQEKVTEVFYKAKQMKRSAASALNAVKKEIRAAVRKQEAVAQLPKEVIDGMTKEQKKAMRKNITKRRRNEVREALRERVKTDAKLGKVDEVFKEARKIFRDAKKRKTSLDRKAEWAQFEMADEQQPVAQESGYTDYSTSQRGFYLNSRWLESTHHPYNRRTLPVPSSLDDAFPRNHMSHNGPDFAGQLYSNDPAYNESHYPGYLDFTGPDYSLPFSDGLDYGGSNFENGSCYSNLTVNVTNSNKKRNKRKGKRRKKHGAQGL